MSSKLSIINGAFSKLRINGFTINPNPGDISVALEVLEDMMLFFEGRTILLGYNFEEEPDLNSQTGVSHEHNLMMKSNLAVNIAPDYGKEIPMRLESMASTTLSNAVGASVNLTEVPYPNRMPLGSGNTLRNNQQHKFYSNFKSSPTGIKMEPGAVNDYAENYHAYLGEETIKSYTIKASAGLTIVTNSKTDTAVVYRLKAGTSIEPQQIDIVVTTNTGRVEPRTIQFDISGIQ